MSRDDVRSFTLGPHQEIEALAHERYDTIIHVGGVGSGKTVTLALWMLDRGRWDTAQEHALFTYTAQQREQVLQRVYPILAKCGVRHVWNCRPPVEWVDRWRREGIPQPPERDRYTNTITLSTGLRVQTGTLFNQAFEQWKGPEWGSVAIEEWTAGPSQQAVEWIMDRARCGDGAEYCAKHHRHTKILHGNPPEDDGHWSFDWLSTLEAKAAALPGGVVSEQEDSYPNLAAGIGSILYIQSSSEDNPHTGTYAQKLRDRLDNETARRRLGGEMRRQRQGLAYSAFARQNEHQIDYDAERTLYVNLDFNSSPLASGLCHPLKVGEFPKEHAVEGISHVGKFGEVFDKQGGGLQALCMLLLTGEAGNLGSVPREWRGLMEHKGPVVFFGDGTGLNKNASGQSLWDIVEELIGKALKQRGIRYTRQAARNEIVPVRVRSHNAKLCSASGIRSFWIDPRCTYTIKDLMSIVWDKTKADVQKYGERGGSDRWLLTHLSDADGYMLTTLFPMGHDLDPANNKPKVIRSKGSEVPSWI